MTTIAKLTILSLALLLGACAGPVTKYHWGTYEPALYQYYKTPSEVENFAAELARTIKQAEEKSQKVPPGIFAEYGHVLQQQGKYAEAVSYYEKEKRAWPESTVLMNAMLKSVDAAPKKKSARAGKPQS